MFCSPFGFLPEEPPDDVDDSALQLLTWAPGGVMSIDIIGSGGIGYIIWAYGPASQWDGIDPDGPC